MSRPMSVYCVQYTATGGVEYPSRNNAIHWSPIPAGRTHNLLVYYKQWTLIFSCTYSTQKVVFHQCATIHWGTLQLSNWQRSVPIVCIKPPLQSLTGELLSHTTANTNSEDGARLDVSAPRCLGWSSQASIFYVRVFHPFALLLDCKDCKHHQPTISTNTENRLI